MEKRVSLKFNINIDMMKSFFLKKVVFIFLLMISFSAFSQHRPVIKNARKVSQPKNIRSHNPWRVGGGVGFSMGSHDYLGLSIAPFVGYGVVRNLELGVSTGYQFTKKRHEIGRESCREREREREVGRREERHRVRNEE